MLDHTGAILVQGVRVGADGYVQVRVQALPLDMSRSAGAVKVTVPWVLYWKTVVFEY